MAEIISGVSNADITFGVQLDSLVERHDNYLRFPHAQNGIGEQYPALRGHERAMVKALGKAVVERIGLMDRFSMGGLAREIVAARQAFILPRD